MEPLSFFQRSALVPKTVFISQLKVTGALRKRTLHTIKFLGEGWRAKVGFESDFRSEVATKRILAAWNERNFRKILKSTFVSSHIFKLEIPNIISPSHVHIR